VNSLVQVKGNIVSALRCHYDYEATALKFTPSIMLFVKHKKATRIDYSANSSMRFLTSFEPSSFGCLPHRRNIFYCCCKILNLSKICIHFTKAFNSLYEMEVAIKFVYALDKA